MKATATVRRLLLFATLLVVPYTAWGQEVETVARGSARPESLLAKPARLNAADMTIHATLTRLSQTSGVPLAYSPTLLPTDVRVHCECERATVEEALTRLLEQTAFSFRESEGQHVPAEGTPYYKPEQGDFGALTCLEVPFVEKANNPNF